MTVPIAIEPAVSEAQDQQVADELENAYRSEVWNPAYSHLREQKQGIRAARVELSSSSVKVPPLIVTIACDRLLQISCCSLLLAPSA